MISFFSIFILGLFAGSFLNCIVYRLEVGESFLKGRSYCPKCKKNIAWFDLVPLLSFLFLNGKCRHCFSKISWHYPIIELTTGILFLLVSYYTRLEEVSLLGNLEIIYFLSISFILLLIFIYDLKHFIIPDEAVISAVSISFIWFLVAFLNNIYSLELITNHLLSAIGASGFFLFFFLVSKGSWMGFGDVKLGFVMGLFLGFPQILLALFLSFFIGAVVGLLIIAIQKKTLKSEIPFAPFLVLGTLIALFWGEFLLTHYLIFSKMI